VLGWSLTVVVHRATGRTASGAGLVTLLSGILAAYSLDRVLDRPTASLALWMTRVLTTAGVGAALVCLVAAVRLPVRTAALVPVLGLLALTYPRLKRQPAMKVLGLPLVWVWAAIALPFNDGSWIGWHAFLLPVTAPLLLLMASGCLQCDLKDEAGDRRAGIASLPALLGGAMTIRIAGSLALLAGGLALVEHRPGIALSAATLGATTLSPSLLATDATGPLLVDVILTLPGLLLSARVF